MARLITESEIRRISENVSRRVIREGYSSSHFMAQLERKMPRVLKWLDKAKNTVYVTAPDREEDVRMDQNPIFRDYFPINLRPFVEDESKLPKEFREDAEILIEYGYAPNLRFPLKVVGRHYENNMARIQIIISNEAMPQHIFSVALHELTHAVDEMIDRWTGSKMKRYRHQVLEVDSLPICIRQLLYILWDTREFTAWQATVENGGIDFNEFVDSIQGWLNDAYRINDPEIWGNVSLYIMMSTGINKNSPRATKKYFIDTTYKKFKKFVKKIRI